MASAAEDVQISAQKIRDRWTQGVKTNQRARNQAALNHQFVRGGKHWRFYNQRSNRLEEYPRDPDRLRVSMARIAPDSRRVMAKLLRRPLDFQVMPRTADDVSAQAARI